MSKEILSVKAVAKKFDVTRFAVNRWIKSGMISAVWTSPHRRGILRSELDRFIAEYDLAVIE